MLRARWLLPLCVVLAVSASAAAQDDAPRAQVLPTPASLELQDGDSIVFLGDSITHQCLYTQYVEDYFYTRMPNVRLKIHNAGVGGARAWDALARFDADVAAYKPKYVTILLGMNDGTYQPYDQPTFHTYRTDMIELLDRIEKIGAAAIPMTPTMYDSRAAFARDPNRDGEKTRLYNSVLAYYGTWLREAAYSRGLAFVDMWSPLNNLTREQRQKDPAFTLIKDAVHPDAPGQVVMAAAIISDLGLPRQVSNIRLNRSVRKEPQVMAKGGEVSDLVWTDDRIEFTWTAECLPWALPEAAQPGVKLTKLGHRLSREGLEIHGLAPGRYTLRIDGEEIGVYPAGTLEHHIELQENPATPQYRQALAVAELNRQRNEGPVRALRGEWLKFQAFARVRREAEAAPTAETAEKLAKAEAAIAGLETRVAEHNAAARALEDRIFEINKPQPRKYLLERTPQERAQ